MKQKARRLRTTEARPHVVELDLDAAAACERTKIALATCEALALRSAIRRSKIGWLTEAQEVLGLQAVVAIADQARRVEMVEDDTLRNEERGSMAVAPRRTTALRIPSQLTLRLPFGMSFGVVSPNLQPIPVQANSILVPFPIANGIAA
ncbi:MAG: hypothetical protein AAF772_13785 [Acidobacteriota bacterium]